MRIGWDTTDTPLGKDGTREHMVRWLEAVACFPGGNRHVCYAYQSFRDEMRNSAAADTVEWRIVGDWPNRLQLRREAYFLRHREEIRRDVDVLVSMWRPPLSWNGKAITVLLDCIQDHYPMVKTLRGLIISASRTYAGRRSGRWIVTTEYTRRDAICIRSYPADRIRVAGIPVADLEQMDMAACPIPPSWDFFGGEYAFYCSAISPRKNHIRLIRAWRRAFPDRSFPLVLAGRFLTTEERDIRREIARAEKDGFVRYLGTIGDVERELLYSRALFMVYPSLFEGFGMPVLEAMQHGCPVLTSMGTSTEEVGGDAVLLVDPTSEDDLMEKLRQLAGDPNLREKLRGRMPAVLARYSRERVACQLNAAIEELASMP